MFLKEKSVKLQNLICCNWRIMLMIFAVGLASQLPAQIASTPKSWVHFLAEADKLGAGQLLLVISRAPGQSRAELHCLERNAYGWQIALPAMAAAVGRKGIAESGAKREGDGQSPWGVFPLGMAFGYQPSHTTRMPYRQMHKEDVWVDDPAAADYNRLVHIDSTTAKSFEYMRRNDNLYKLGLVVEYNTNPVVPGLGSAIFVHIWGRPFGATAGCLALPEHKLEEVLGFLDPAKAPAIGFFRVDQR